MYNNTKLTKPRSLPRHMTRERGIPIVLKPEITTEFPGGFCPAPRTTGERYYLLALSLPLFVMLWIPNSHLVWSGVRVLECSTYSVLLYAVCHSCCHFTASLFSANLLTLPHLCRTLPVLMPAHRLSVDAMVFSEIKRYVIWVSWWKMLSHRHKG